MNRLIVLFLVACVVVGCSDSSGLTTITDTLTPAKDLAAADDSEPADQSGDHGRDDITCIQGDHKACCGNAVCWFDSCGQQEETVVQCPSGCEDSHCKNCTPACANKECGGDGCGGDCGFCDLGKCDGLVWTAAKACASGTCLGGNVLSCDDGEVCTDDLCDTKTGCTHVPNAASCDDGDPCTTGDLCSVGLWGLCRPGQALDCDDKNPCTKDSCIRGAGCRHADQLDGTECATGACEALSWTSTRTCKTGICQLADISNCDDDVPCTIDACTPAIGCSNTIPVGKCVIDGVCAVENQTDNGNDCRLCAPDLDTSTWTVLEDGESCGLGEYCYKGTCGTCLVDCSGKECGDDGCGGVCGTCQGSCSGGWWTRPTTCVSGQCEGVGDSVSCDDGKACTTDDCHPVNGCINTIVTAKCLIEGQCYDDGQVNPSNPCQSCNSRSTTSSWTTCASGRVCFQGSCCTLNCVGKECGDDGCGGVCGTCEGSCLGSLWTRPGTCLSSRCEVVGNSVSCDDGKACTTDECHPVNGCTNTIVTAKCLIAGQCYDDGQVNPSNACQSCNSGISTSSWTTCASGGVCFQGSCCTPSCAGKDCGNDGCGSVCGTCSPLTLCDGTGQCVPGSPCNDFPNSWGPISAVSTLQTPSVLADVQAKCFDYTGDGKGDNGMKGLAGQINKPLADSIIAGDYVALFAFPAGLNFTNSGVFELYGLTGKSVVEPPATTGDFYVDPISYASDCRPVNRFVDAQINGGDLTASATDLWVRNTLVFADTSYMLHLTHVRLKALLATGGASGVKLDSGVLSGIMTKEELVTMVGSMQAECDATPAGTTKPSFCSYLGVVNGAMGLLFDLHQVRDDAGVPTGEFVAKSKELPGDAASVCLTFSSSVAAIAGLMP